MEEGLKNKVWYLTGMSVEDIKKSLSCCVNQTLGKGTCEDLGCPLYRQGTEGSPCYAIAMHAAEICINVCGGTGIAEILKKPEDIILGMVYWIEYEGALGEKDDDFRASPIVFDRIDEEGDYRTSTNNFEIKNHYGRVWRLWTKRPSVQQMREAKWQKKRKPAN